MKKTDITAALTEFFNSEAGRQLVGGLFFDAIRQAMVYDIEYEDNSEPGKTMIKTEQGDILSHIAKWIMNSEGAIRGAQADAASARNRAGQAREASVETTRLVNMVGKILTDIEQPLKTIAANIDPGILKRVGQ